MSAQGATGAPSDGTHGLRDDDPRPSSGLVNGVSTAERLADAAGSERVVALDNPNVHDPNPGDLRQPTSSSPVPGEVFLGAVEPNYSLQPDGGASVITQEISAHGVFTPVNREPRRTPPPPDAVRVQEFFTAESAEAQDTREQSGVRWMARFTEFLRLTASRGASSVDRVLDNLGLTNPQAVSQDGRMVRAIGSPLRFSPPEDLPPRAPQRGPPAPTSWAAASSAAPLFGPAQVAQMRQSQREHPQIYGYQAVSEDSDRSSRLQAEVQRQLDEYTTRYQQQMNTLLREVQVLRAEREEWQARGSISTAGRDPQNLPADPTVPQGNPQHLPPQVPGGLQSGGNFPGREQRGTVQTSNIPPVAKEPVDEGAPVVAPQPRRERADDPQNLQADPTVPRGNPQHLPHGRFDYGHARGQESGTNEGHARGQESHVEGHKESSESGHGGPHDPRSNAQKQESSSTSTTRQWLNQTPPSDPITLIAGGVAQLQAAMLKQMSEKSGERTPEAVKPGTSILPVLPPIRVESASVDLLDWLELIEAPMADLSDGSSTWWRKVRATAAAAYDVWVVSGPIERLSVFPESVGDLEEGRWSRVNSRAASMILAALHESIRSELVSRRMTGSVTAILFRLLTLYQPGGEEEKYRTLQQLQSPPRESDPGKAVEALRAWNRWLRRCEELNIQPPDPSLQARALNSIVKGVFEKNSEANFRTQLVRSNLKIDSNPTKDSVEKLYKHVMGECETLVTAMPLPTVSTTTTVVKPEAKLKPVKPEGRTTAPTTSSPTQTRSPSQNTSASGGEEDKEKRATIPCKFFGKTYKGCARLGKCPFLHSWEGLEKEKPSRCLACGGKHMAKDCPNKKQQSTSSTTSATPTTKAPPATPRTPPSSSSSTAAASKTVRIDEVPEVEAVPAREDQATADLRDVLADVGKMLKAMSATTMKKFAVEDDVRQSKVEAASGEPMKVATTEANGEAEEAMGLLDSGASHSMRPAQSEEYERGQPVHVTLAGEDVRVLRQNPQGTILVKEDKTMIQPIVPLGAVIEELGYTLHWGPTVLRLTHPNKKPIKVKIKNHCPEVAACDALDLIRELEMNQLKTLASHVDNLRARLEVIKKEEGRSWMELLKEFAKTGSKPLLLKAVLVAPFTKDLPSDVQSLLVEGFDPQQGESYVKALPLPRKKRRSLITSRNWVVSLFISKGDSQHDPFDVIPRAGKTTLEIDMSESRLWGVHREAGVYQLLLWAASTGRISDVVSTPPCRTWHTSATPLHGPDSYPMRTKQLPNGVEDLTVSQKQRVVSEMACAAKTMIVWMLAQMCGQRNVGFIMEYPATSEKITKHVSTRASIWDMEMWKWFQSISGVKEVSFYMGAYGHKAQRPTTIATNYPSLMQLDINNNFHDDCVPSSLLSTRELRRWPRFFRSMVAEAISDYHSGKWEDEEELVKAGIKLSKLTKEQREAWQRHLFNDHQPYRSDCSVCINAQATGYQHRRRKHPMMYTMALDLAGPFRQKGRDMEFDDYKYIMVAAYRCPKEYLNEKALMDLDKDLYVPDEPTEAEGDDPMELQPDPRAKDLPMEVDDSEEEKERVPAGPETLDEAVEGLAHQDEWATVYVTRPLRGRTNHYVVQAAKEIYLQLKQSGLHVAVIHTDRAREFKAKAFKEWTVDAQLRHTRTAGGDPAGNSSAELGIKWAKARVRALLMASGAPAKDWPMAIQHASSQLWTQAFPDSPWTNPPATAFGSEVWFRSKVYQGKKEKKHDAASMRWKKGWYRGPAVDVKRGHLLMREDGGLTVAKSVKFGVRDVDKDQEIRDLLQPSVAVGVPDDENEVTSISRKNLEDEIEFKARVSLEEEKFGVKDILDIYSLLEELGNVDTRVSKKRGVTSWFTGAYVRGGVAGIRNNMEKFPYTTKFLVAAAKSYVGATSFSAVGISRNTELGVHKDSHNYAASSNTVVPLTSFSGGGLWIQEEDVPEEKAIKKSTPSGKDVKGYIQELREGVAVSFSPRCWHEVQPWEGERIVLLTYTPRATKLGEEHIKLLEDYGFPLDPSSWVRNKDEDSDEENKFEAEPSMVSGPRVKVLKCEHRGDEQALAFEEIEDDDLFPEGAKEVPYGECGGLPDPLLEQDVHLQLKKMMKKAEVQYTHNIEAVLKEHEDSGKPLEVTHTVSLNEVKKDIEKWRKSALKEFTNLKDVKRAFTVKRKCDLPPDCRLVPCKGVYTVKPDKSEAGYRRKTRFVACGNHMPEDMNSFDLFAAGLDATSLRIMLSYNAKRPWKLGTTDVRQAFVLAKWLGQPVALEPPGIAYELGLASPGEVWFVEQAIYGLRESPALWSQFRDEQLRLARWEMEVGNVNVTMKLEQMVSDNQIWKVVRADNESPEVYGFVLVYIDDLLIHAQEEAMQSFFRWVSAKWEVDALDVLEFDHPIRFLGMEVRRVQGGIELSQEGFINEILRSYQHKGGRSFSQGPRETLLLSDEEEKALINAEPTTIDSKDPALKEAQKRVGELLWLVGRTRPDLQHTVSIMASRITRCPAMVNKVGERLLDYLNETKYYRLAFTEPEEPVKELDVFTDSSFAPSGGRSQGAAVIFYGPNPIVWRAGRQQLTTLSTAESELLEAVEGTLLGLSTKGLMTELTGKEIPLTIWVDNQAAIALLTTSSGSWRTRHLRLRSNWVKEMYQRQEISIKYVPGELQRADLGTKPFTRERLRQLVQMWNIKDRRPTADVKRAHGPEINGSWMRRLLMLCQLCGSAAQKPEIQPEVPWDLYLAVIVLGVAVIGLWEGAKHCLGNRGAKVKMLRAKTLETSSGKITRNELKELQVLMMLQPTDLTVEQKERLLDLKEKFDDTMPEGCSPLPRFTTTSSPNPEQPLGSEASSSSSTPPVGRNKQPKKKEMKDQSTQADYVPAFTRVEPPPRVQREVISGPFFQVPGRDHLHISRECWGLRHAGRVEQVTMCRCCLENNGHRMY